MIDAWRLSEYHAETLSLFALVVLVRLQTCAHRTRSHAMRDRRARPRLAVGGLSCPLHTGTGLFSHPDDELQRRPRTRECARCEAGPRNAAADPCTHGLAVPAALTDTPVTVHLAKECS
eukprot:6526436-Prymnesium_polylepis.1